MENILLTLPGFLRGPGVLNTGKFLEALSLVLTAVKLWLLLTGLEVCGLMDSDMVEVVVVLALLEGPSVHYFISAALDNRQRRFQAFPTMVEHLQTHSPVVVFQVEAPVVLIFFSKTCLLPSQ